MGFVTNGEHDQMMRDQQRDLTRIATALETANHLKWLELYEHYAEVKGDRKLFWKGLVKTANACGWEFKEDEC